MSITTTPDFDADTGLEPLGNGRWRANVPEHWFIQTGPNGGWMAAVATRAMTLTVTDRPPRSLTLHFLEPPAAGPLEVSCTVEREGRTTAYLSLRMTQGDRLLALGLAACAAWREGQPEWADASMPEVAAPEDCPLIPHDRPGMPVFWLNWEGRVVRGRPGGGEDTVIGWLRPSGARGRDPVLIAALTDAWMPAAFARAGEPVIVPTMDLTIHWRAPASFDEGHPWTLGVFTTRAGGGGVWEEDGELWSEDGRLLAISRQLAIVRRPRA